MDTVKVNKDELLAQLRENREKHVDTYNEVLEAYFIKATELLQEHIDRIKEGAVEQVMVSLPMPKNYEEEYDLAIAMLEWSQDDIIELDSVDFNRYVRDQWRWKQEFAATSAMYTQ